MRNHSLFVCTRSRRITYPVPLLNLQVYHSLTQVNNSSSASAGFNIKHASVEDIRRGNVTLTQ